MPTLLLIDDDPDLAVVVRRTLRAYDVTVAPSAEDALARLAHARFDVLLCDLQLPGMSGAAFQAELARLYPELDRRLVMVTGGALDEASEAFLEGRGDAVVTKPFELDRLRRVVARAAAPTGSHPRAAP